MKERDYKTPLGLIREIGAKAFIQNYEGFKAFTLTGDRKVIQDLKKRGDADSSIKIRLFCAITIFRNNWETIILKMIRDRESNDEDLREQAAAILSKEQNNPD